MARPHADQLIFEHLKNGASVDMNVDGSSTAVEFSWTCPAARTAGLMRINFYIVDGAVYLPQCRLKEQDDFGSANCLYIPGM